MHMFEAVQVHNWYLPAVEVTLIPSKTPRYRRYASKISPSQVQVVTILKGKPILILPELLAETIVDTKFRHPEPAETKSIRGPSNLIVCKV